MRNHHHQKKIALKMKMIILINHLMKEALIMSSLLILGILKNQAKNNMRMKKLVLFNLHTNKKKIKT